MPTRSFMPDLGRFLRFLLLATSILVIPVLIGPAEGSVSFPLSFQLNSAITSPPVSLQAGTTGSSTIYANNTSAKTDVTAPVPTYDFVDSNSSNVDSSIGKGSHSNFTAQQYGPDLVYDTLTEVDTDTPSNTTIFTDGFEDQTFTKWTDGGTTTWVITSAQRHGGTYSATAGDANDGSLTSDNINMSTATSIFLSFWYRDDDLDAGGDFYLYYYDGSAYDLIADLQSATEDTWLYYSATITDSQYFISNFRIRFTAIADFGENAWVDDVTVNRLIVNTNYELDLEVQWTSADYNEMKEELAIYTYEGNNTRSLDATGGYMIIGAGTPNWGSVTGTISFWIKWDTLANRPWGQHENMETRISVTNLILDWGAAGSLTSTTSFAADRWYFLAIVWNENTDNLYFYVGNQTNSPTLDNQNNAWTSSVSTAGVTQNNFLASKMGVNPIDGHGEDLRYWNTDRTQAQIQSDYKKELTGSETNLRSYFKLNNNFDDIGPNNNDGSGSGSYSFSSDVPFEAPPTENIRIDVWNGSTWQNLLTDLNNGWNNVSVSSYLTSSTFTLRFKGNTETSDTSQDVWKIDVTLLHMWNWTNYNYVLRINENQGSSWKVRLKAYDQSNLPRLLNSSIYLYDGSNSSQIVILNGAYNQQTGPWYDLTASDIEYIWMHVEVSNTGTSYVYVYLEILIPNTTIYARYVITFKIS